MLRLLWVTGGILFLAGGISAPHAPLIYAAQPPAYADAADLEAQVSEALDAGLSLEQQLLWNDGLHHYETSLRKFPGNATLQQRMLICRLHHDVQRRYQDVTYLRSIRETPTQQSLDLYAEVLANLETHYVDGVDWKQLVRLGTASLEVALTEPLFINRDHLGRCTRITRARGDRRHIIAWYDTQLSYQRVLSTWQFHLACLRLIGCHVRSPGERLRCYAQLLASVRPRTAAYLVLEPLVLVSPRALTLARVIKRAIRRVGGRGRSRLPGSA
jgi:hypothetical protein